MYAYKRVNRFNVILTLSGMPNFTNLAVLTLLKKGEGVEGQTHV